MVFQKSHLSYRRLPRLGNMDPSEVADNLADIIKAHVKPTDIHNDSFLASEWDEEARLEKCTMDQPF